MDDLFLRRLFQSDRQARSNFQVAVHPGEYRVFGGRVELHDCWKRLLFLVEWNLYVYDLVYDVIGGRLSSDFLYLYLCTLTVLYFIMY